MNNGQGTWPFMPANLVEDASAVHTYWGDLESSLWLLLWTTIMFTVITIYQTMQRVRSGNLCAGRAAEAERSLTDHPRP